jgi:hypothetical protein
LAGVLNQMKVKCRYCDIKDTEREEMKVEVHTTDGGNTQRKYYHIDCYPKYKVEKEFKEKEYEQLVKLVDTILEVHKIKNIPNQFYPFIQDLRNGTVLFGKNKKRYKDGYPYSLIAKTYEFCRESIEYWKKNKDFDSTMGELKYCWAIINDKINVVKKKEEKKSFQKAKSEAEQKEQQKNGTVNHHAKVVEFKKKQREDDISDFL